MSIVESPRLINQTKAAYLGCLEDNEIGFYDTSPTQCVWALCALGMCDYNLPIEYIELYDEEADEWNLPKFKLEQIQDLEPDQIVNTYLNEMGQFQNIALAWSHVEGRKLNDHGSKHIRDVWTSVKTLVDINGQFTNEDKKILALATAFHDSGMFVAGRKNHELNSIEVLRHVFGESWNPSEPFCQRVEELIRLHVTSEDSVKQAANDPLLAVLILADETQQARRTPPTAKVNPRDYQNDPWIRIGTHITDTSFYMEDGMLYYQVNVDRTEIDNDAKESLGSDLCQKMICPKSELLYACVRGGFGQDARLGIDYDGEKLSANEFKDKYKFSHGETVIL